MPICGCNFLDEYSSILVFFTPFVSPWVVSPPPPSATLPPCPPPPLPPSPLAPHPVLAPVTQHNRGIGPTTARGLSPPLPPTPRPRDWNKRVIACTDLLLWLSKNIEVLFWVGLQQACHCLLWFVTLAKQKHRSVILGRVVTSVSLLALICYSG